MVRGAAPQACGGAWAGAAYMTPNAVQDDAAKLQPAARALLSDGASDAGACSAMSVRVAASEATVAPGP